ncbi:efflux RND transporter periplasmic adaptor subunit [Prolixibacteraceae bacterium Z1-6]|uniref:Efflux RND transporter periplasmic adaptor subunit n=1 Tax=Draconibacterium aestuarii TaxID=2998507 RepID=A0A9X3FDN8_9BACT|nr:efflux RND transporter periplasmic adaptor subunit [Prolixibacteraceae bacterium Z1-6]
MKDLIQNIKQNYKLILGVLVVGIFLGWLFFHSNSKTTMSENAIENHEGHDHESEDPTTWTCSMHPQIKQDNPGDCPICGMDLIPLSSMQTEGDNVNPNEIMMSESAAKLADIQTMIVSSGSPQKSILLQGKIQEDERRISEITARFGGRIEELFVNFEGQNVQKGEKLATIYSPELVTAQRELLEAVSYKETRLALYTAAKGKLKLWDLNEKQIKNIEEKGEPLLYFDVLSPISGTVILRHVALGDYVKEGTGLFKVVDLTRVWALFDAYESDLPWIKVNDKVDYTIQGIPGKSYSGKVSFIDPFIDSKTRVAKVRVELNNAKQEAKPEMFTTGMLESKIAGSGHEILIPKTALLWTGKRAVVYVKVQDRENPSFLYREIVLGPEAGNFYVVKEGLNEGEEIAVNGVFKIDAAAQLQGLQSMMNPEGGDSGAGKMPGMDMGNGSQSGSKTLQSSEDMTMKPVDADPAFKKQLTAVYETYLKMKDAFVATDAQKVSQEAQKVEKSIQSVQMELLKGDAHMAWMDQLKTLNSSINTIAKSADIEKQRIEFARFNLAFYKSLKMFGLANDTAYYQYCPMANGDKGAYWFSETDEIRNPYFGDMMLSCGETRETIK